MRAFIIGLLMLVIVSGAICEAVETLTLDVGVRRQYEGVRTILIIGMTKTPESKLSPYKVFALDQDTGDPMIVAIASTTPPVVLVYDARLTNRTIYVTYDIISNPYQAYYFTPDKILGVILYDEFDDLLWSATGTVRVDASRLVVSGSGFAEVSSLRGMEASVLVVVDNVESYHTLRIRLVFGDGSVSEARITRNSVTFHIAVGNQPSSQSDNVGITSFPIVIVFGRLVNYDMRSVKTYGMVFTQSYKDNYIQTDMRKAETGWVNLNNDASSTFDVEISGSGYGYSMIDRIIVFDNKYPFYQYTGGVTIKVHSPSPGGFYSDISVVSGGEVLRIERYDGRVRTIIREDSNMSCALSPTLTGIELHGLRGWTLRSSGLASISIDKIADNTLCIPLNIGSFKATTIVYLTQQLIIIQLEPAGRIELDIPAISPTPVIKNPGVLSALQAGVLGVLASLFIALWRRTGRAGASLLVAGSVSLAIAVVLSPIDSGLVDIVPALISAVVIGTILELR